MKRSFDSTLSHAGLLALAACASAAIGFGAALEGYSQLQHPLAWLGAHGVARAAAFNALGFVLPGLLAAGAALMLRARLPTDAGWAARIGSGLLLLSTLAFAAQGGFPLDADDLDGPRSQLHATCWSLWWIAFVSGAALLAVAVWRVPGWRGYSVRALLATIVALLLVLVPTVLPPPLAQRLAIGAWFACLVAIPRKAA
ncbi:MAG TPA: DUF998 domain-containing protein [Lysobacter sp.]